MSPTKIVQGSRQDVDAAQRASVADTLFKQLPGLTQLRRLHADEDGKISIVSVFTILAIIMFTGLILNTTVSVKEKIEMQNAADVAAYTTNLWRARAMNAITTTNHLMGEATAVLVLVDGFGGRLLESTDRPINSEEFEGLNTRLDNSKGAAVSVEAIPGVAETVPPELSAVSEGDKQLVTMVINAMTGDQGQASAGAALYDSRVRLKELALDIFFLKDLLNTMLGGINTLAAFPLTKPYAMPVQYGLVLTHVALSTQLLPIIQEWYTLELVEGAVRLVQPAEIAKGIELGLLPALTAYCDYLAIANAGATQWQQGLTVNLKQIQVDHHLSSLAISPAVNELRLPLMQEIPPKIEPPSGSSTAKYDVPPRGWDSGFNSKTEMERIFLEMARWVQPLQHAVKTVENKVRPIIDVYERLKRWTDFMGIGKYVDPFITLFRTMKRFDEAKAKDQKRNDGSDQNPCRNQNSDKNYCMDKFYWDDERYSQWTRATYPYVDQHRKKIVDIAKSIAKHSNFATYYVNYTNRYTLYRAYSLRKVESDKSGQNTKANLNPLRKLLSELATQFATALEPVDETVDSGPAPFEKFERQIFDEILPLAKRLPAGSRVREWIKKADRLHDNIKAAGQNAVANWSEDFDISKDDLQALAEQIERINRIAELLSLFDDLLDQFEIPRPHMWVMQQMDGRNKGNEPWVTDSELAHKLFTAEAAVKREAQQIFMSPVFYTQLSGERECRANSMLYNANGRGTRNKDESKTVESNHQPNTSWDTLNWFAPVTALEWNTPPNTAKDIKSKVALKWSSCIVP